MGLSFRGLTHDGNSLVRINGVKFCRKKALTETQVQELIQKYTKALLIKDLMKLYKFLKHPSIVRWMTMLKLNKHFRYIET